MPQGLGLYAPVLGGPILLLQRTWWLRDRGCPLGAALMGLSRRSSGPYSLDRREGEPSRKFTFHNRKLFSQLPSKLRHAPVGAYSCTSHLRKESIRGRID